MTTSVNAFESLIDGYLNELFDENPVLASTLGVDGYYDRTGDFSEQGFLRREEQTDAWLAKFEEVDGDELGSDQLIDRDLVVSSLKGSIVLRDWEVWRRNPDVYLAAGLYGVFGLFLHRLLPEEELVDAAVARLEAARGTLMEGMKNLRANMAAPLFVQRALGQCRAGIEYFRNLIPSEVPEGLLRDRIVSSGNTAAAAFEEFATFLEKLEPSATGHWAIGEERYSELLVSKETLGYGAKEMLERGRAAFSALDSEMSQFASKHFGNSEWRDVMEDLRKDGFASHDDMRNEYEEWTERARQFLIDRDLVTLPEGESCVVEPSPPFQRPVLQVASYSTPPAFKPSLMGHFFVPYPPEGSSPEEVRKRLVGRTRHGIATTSVHEAYPGHHWHLVTSQSNPRRVRQVIRTSYFSEGWALYAEKMMREEGFFDDPRRELCHLGARIFRAARIVVDTSLHIGEMTFEDALKYLGGLRGEADATIEAEVGRYCSWPTQAPSYLTGSLEIERMRERYFSLGLGDLKTFHNTIALTGSLPLGLAERALIGS